VRALPAFYGSYVHASSSSTLTGTGTGTASRPVTCTTVYIQALYPLPSSIHYLSYDNHLENKRENYQNCSILQARLGPTKENLGRQLEPFQSINDSDKELEENASQHTTTIVLRPFVRDYPGEPVTEETFTHPLS